MSNTDLLREIHTKWYEKEIEKGNKDHFDGYWLSIVGEEFGEVCKALVEQEGPMRLREELIDLVVGAVAWIEGIDKRIISGGDDISLIYPTVVENVNPYTLAHHANTHRQFHAKVLKSIKDMLNV